LRQPPSWSSALAVVAGVWLIVIGVTEIVHAVWLRTHLRATPAG